MSGWVKVWRQVKRNSCYRNKPFCEFGAWIDLIMEANFEPKLDSYGELVRRGEIHTSAQYLAERWGWTRSRVVRFLDHLKNEQQVILQTSRKRTKVRITNYEMYQADTPKSEQRPDNKRGTDDTTDSTQHKKEEGRRKNFLERGCIEVRADIFLTPEEQAAWIDETSPEELSYWLDRLEEYSQNSSKQFAAYKNHNLVIRSWRNLSLKRNEVWDPTAKTYRQGSRFNSAPKAGNPHKPGTASYELWKAENEKKDKAA